MESKTGKFLKRIFRPVRRDDYQMDISEMQNQNNDEEGEE